MSWDWVLQTDRGQAVFGDDAARAVASSWVIEPGKSRVDDRELPRADGLRFGQDFRGGQTARFSLWVSGDDEADVLAELAALATVWRNDGGRTFAGSMATLRHPNGRFMFGRPRSFEADAQRAGQGYATVKAVFEAQDDLWYGPEELTRIRFVPPVSGGLTFPAEAPFTFDSGATTRNGSVLVAGDVESWPVFEISGPVTNPEVEVVGVGRLMFKTTLAYDQFLRVDTRPWARWVQRGFVQNPTVLSPLPGALSPSGSRLSDMALRPGAYQVLLRGYDPSGTAELGVVLNPAYTSF